MKKIILILMSLATLLPAPAQWLRSEPLEGALWGGLVGGLLGGGRHHGFSGNGAAIGAGVGLLAGTLASESRGNYYSDSPGYGFTTYPSVSFGYGYGSCGSSAYLYYAPNYYCAPGYYYRPTRPNYVVSGTVLGAASGALIGAGRHDAGKGAAIGAAAGLVLGSVAEHSVRNEERLVASTYQSSAVAVQPQLVSPQPTVPKPGVTSKPGATSTYYWTPRPQIADAPRVPDAPTF